jgi:hypothetical protein
VAAGGSRKWKRWRMVANGKDSQRRLVVAGGSESIRWSGDRQQKQGDSGKVVDRVGGKKQYDKGGSRRSRKRQRWRREHTEAATVGKWRERAAVVAAAG